MAVELNIENLQIIRRFLEELPEEAEKVFRSSANSALKKAHREALIQISRRYTIGMAAVEKDLKEIAVRGGSAAATLYSRGRPRGARNFNVRPYGAPDPGYTSRSGYAAEILRGSARSVSRDYFWLRGRGGNVIFARRIDAGDHSKGSTKSANLEVFSTVSTPQMLGNEEVFEKVSEVTKTALEELFAKGMERRFGRR